jgi:hypothetical protein
MNALEVRTIEGWPIASGPLRGLGLERQVDVTPLCVSGSAEIKMMSSMRTRR